MFCFSTLSGLRQLQRNFKLKNFQTNFKFSHNKFCLYNKISTHFSSTVSSTKSEDKLQIDPAIKKIMQNLDNNIIKRDYYVNILNFFKDKSTTVNEKGLMQNLFMKYFELAINKNIINSFTIHELIPQVLKEAARLEINSFAFWKNLNELFNKNYHKMGPNIIFDFFNGFDEAYPQNPNVILLKNVYFGNLTRDKVLSFNVETLLNYLKCYVDFIQDQSFLDEISKLIVILDERNKNLSLAEINKHLIKVIKIVNSSDSYKNKKINFTEILLGLFPLFRNNFQNLEPTLQIEVLKLYADNKQNLLHAKFDFIENISELAKISDDSFRNNIEDGKFSLDQVVEFTQTISDLNVGSNQLFLEIDRFIGINIENLKPEKILTVLESFVKAKKYREKFTLLLQKKISDSKFQINLSDLSKLIKIYTDINCDNIYIYDKLRTLFLNAINFLSLKDLYYLVYAYGANQHLKDQNNKVLDKAELIVLSKLDQLEKGENVKELIGLLYVFSLDANSENYLPTANKLKEILLKLDLSKVSFGNDSEVVNLLFKIFSRYNIESMAEKNQNLIVDNLKLFDKTQLKDLNVSIKILSMNKNENLIKAIEGSLENKIA